MYTRIHDYGKILITEHRYLDNLYDGEVVIQEKYDGSQFSAAMLEDGVHVRTKSREYEIEAPEAMFIAAHQTIKDIQDLLTPGSVYRFEYLSKPKHNVLCYDRIPLRHLVLFDVEYEPGAYLSPKELELEANRLGVEPVKVLFQGYVTDKNFLLTLLENNSTLGGQKVEGIVVKNYNARSEDGKLVKGKIVSADFKEVHQADWKLRNPGRKDVIESIIDSYATVARFNKAILHLKEDGKLTDSPKDIGPLINYVKDDILAEEEESIKKVLFDYFKGDIMRGCTRGLPEYYKRKLAGFEE